MSEVLRISSGIWSTIHIVILFILSSFPKLYSKKSTAVLCGIMVLIIAANIMLFLNLGQDGFGKIILISVTFPFFFAALILSKKRDTQFVFTFCLVNTVSTAIIVLSLIFNCYISPTTNLFMFISRIAGFLLIEIGVIKRLRRQYFEIQESVKKGWGIFTMTAAAFLITIIALSTFPSVISERPDDMPMLITLIILMLLMYLMIFQTLSRQKELNEIERENELWQIELKQMQRRIRQMNETNEQIKIARHDMRHRLSGIDVMLKKGEINEAEEYIASSLKTLEYSGEKLYCKNAVLDAIFSYYFSLAKEADIEVAHDLNISDELPVKASELSVVVANALENAIHACEAINADNRIIRCRCIETPQFMLQVSNPYSNEIKTDENGIPIGADGNHGIGTRSILAFCEKYGAQVNYKIGKDIFSIRIVIQKLPPPKIFN